MHIIAFITVKFYLLTCNELKKSCMLKKLFAVAQLSVVFYRNCPEQSELYVVAAEVLSAGFVPSEMSASLTGTKTYHS